MLGETHLAVQDAVRAYVREQVAPHAAAWDRDHTFPREALRGLAALGCYGVAVPAELGGAGLDTLALAVILEEIAAGDGATSTIVSVNNCPVCSILLAWGDAAQQSEWLRPLAAGEMLGAFCLTEPHVGSQADGLTTRARRVQDAGGDAYVIDGVKQFITSGRHADVAIVMAVTDPAAGKKGISAFLVPTATPGYTVARLEEKLGQHASDTAQIVFEGCRIPARYRLGEEGQGLKIALSGLEGGRIGIASQSVGMARAAFEAALAYAKERVAFGKPIFEHQAVQFRLADMATRIEAARQLIHHAAQLKDAGRPCLKEAAMAKLTASEMAERVCSDAIQIHGGYGYVRDFPVERIYRDVRVCQIYEGTSDVQRMLIARALWGHARRLRPGDGLDAGKPGWAAVAAGGYRRSMNLSRPLDAPSEPRFDRVIDFYFDFSSPYSYIASEWIEALAARHGRRVQWHAILLGATFQAAELRAPVDYPIKREYALHDFARSARYAGVPYVPPPRFPLPTQNAARVYWWLHDQAPARAVAWARAGLRAMFTREADLSNPARLRALAAECGLDADAAEAAWNDPVWKLRLKQVNERAIAAGVFGAPFFMVDGEPFWGQDRRPQIERWLEQGPF